MWTYDPRTMQTDDERDVIIPRVRVEEAIARLSDAGIVNRLEQVRIMKALTGLRRGEIRFTVGLVAVERESLLAGAEKTKARCEEIISMTSDDVRAEHRRQRIANRLAEALLLQRGLEAEREPMLFRIVQEYYLEQERDRDACRSSIRDTSDRPDDHDAKHLKQGSG